MALPPPDAKFFLTFFEHPSVAEPFDHIGTVNIVSLLWLEHCASTSIFRSLLWDKNTLESIKEQANGYFARGDILKDSILDKEFILAKIETTRGLLLRTITASQVLLSLPGAPIPLLPADIIYCVFQCLALQSVIDAKKLSTLSRTVQQWADPYVFRRIIPLNETAYQILVNLNSSRLVQARTKYFSAVTLREDLPITDDFHREFPTVRSISFLGYHQIPSKSIPALRRLETNSWNANQTPLSSQIFRSLTHLSLQPSPGLHIYRIWDFSPLKQLLNLTHLLFHSHSSSSPLYANDAHAEFWTEFLVQHLIPSLPSTLRLLVWMAGEVLKSGSFTEYRPLWDGTVYPRLIRAFQKGAPNSDRHQTSESAGSGSSAYVYSVHPLSKSLGLDWLECFWEDVERFAIERQNGCFPDLEPSEQQFAVFEQLL
ncbi:hypothetical protein DL96DRAFT_1625520 [Flagelloscypha sp. PMI_526]|nr:hypothetical protein DL96DRAFT_1625520 [Flagelloscypha sp. PMI_526]